MAGQQRDPSFVVSVGLRLKAVRLALEMDKQAPMHKALGVAHNRYSQWEGGTRLADPVIMAKLCSRFKVSMDWIYLGDPSHLPLAIGEKTLAIYEQLLTEFNAVQSRERKTAHAK